MHAKQARLECLALIYFFVVVNCFSQAQTSSKKGNLIEKQFWPEKVSLPLLREECNLVDQGESVCAPSMSFIANLNACARCNKQLPGEIGLFGIPSILIEVDGKKIQTQPLFFSGHILVSW